MESVEGRSNKFALDARRRSPSPIALSAQPDHVPQDLSNQRSRADGSCVADSLLSLCRDFHRATAQANIATHHMLFLESCLEGSQVPSGLQHRLKPKFYREAPSDVSSRIAKIVEQEKVEILKALAGHYTL